MAAEVARTEPYERARRYRLKAATEIFPLDSAATGSRFVVSTAEGRSFVISEALRDILVLFDGSRTLEEIQAAISKRQGAPVTDGQMQQIIVGYIDRYGLIEEASSGSAASPTPAAPPGDRPRQRAAFDFIFRMPLISPRMASPIVSRLLWLFRPAVAILAMSLVVVIHLALYRGWIGAPPAVHLDAAQLVILYMLALGTALVHEFGHAAACRNYGCEHGAIGVCIYFVFPALYVNLSRAWRLPGRQRAVIDIGGIYFQLLTTIPLFAIYLLTGNPYCTATIYSVDLMVLFSLNPILKFDGYWLLVDLSGLVNLQQRGLRVVVELAKWSVGAARGIPTLKQVEGAGKRLLLVSYSVLFAGLLAGFLLLLLSVAPAQFVRLGRSFVDLFSSLGKGVPDTLVSAGRLLMNLIFILFIYRLLNQTVFRLFKRPAQRKTQ